MWGRRAQGDTLRAARGMYCSTSQPGICWVDECTPRIHWRCKPRRVSGCGQKFLNNARCPRCRRCSAGAESSRCGHRGGRPVRMEPHAPQEPWRAEVEALHSKICSVSLEPGSQVYLVSTKWMKKWEAYAQPGQHGTQPCPGMVQNAPLLHGDGQLRESLVRLFVPFNCRMPAPSIVATLLPFNCRPETLHHSPARYHRRNFSTTKSYPSRTGSSWPAGTDVISLSRGRWSGPTTQQLWLWTRPV